jgi:uncharacterized protein (DUF1919 family)
MEETGGSKEEGMGDRGGELFREFNHDYSIQEGRGQWKTRASADGLG